MDIRKLIRPHILDITCYAPGEEGEDHVKLSSNENPRPPHPRIIEAVAAEMARANRYPLSGSPELTAALAAVHGVGRNEIMVGSGSNEIIDLLVRAFVAPEDSIVFPSPSFIAYGLVARICGCTGIAVPCRDYRLDLPAMRAAVRADTRMVFLCNPNNPTSTYVTAAEVDAFVRGLRDDILVVMDEAYVEYVDASDYPDSLALRRERNTVVILRTFSKFYSLAGARAGYAIADPVVIDALHRVRQPFNVSRLAQAAALAAISLAPELRSNAVECSRERTRVRAALLELGLQCPPSQANFVFADLGSSGVDLFQELAARGVMVRRLGQFGSAHNTYRISIGTPAENDRLIAAVRAIFDRADGQER